MGLFFEVKMQELTQERIKEFLNYDQDTGIFTWRIGRGGVCSGKTSGYLGPGGYVYIKINGKSYLSHRLVWLYVHGYFPENQIDHIDRVKHNNSIANLREASRSCNMRNTDLQDNNTSGVKGVYFHSASGKWKVQVMVNRKSIHLGYYADKIDAAKARYSAELEHNFIDCQTTSTAKKYIDQHGATK